MLIPKQLKLNKFRDVRIPSNREYFQRFGLVNPNGSYTGDEVAPGLQSKIDSIVQAAREEARQVAKEWQDSQKANAEITE